MSPAVAMLMSATAVASAVLRLAQYWIQSRHQAKLAHEYDSAVLNALPRLPPGYLLEHRAPDGSQWLIRLDAPNPPRKRA